ncbi:MAG: hypothetical protein IVW57_04685 [Ktedonobacterales bacterium]|nr:hypothetical protein [Ktedonobacterales bacterium]
MLDLDAPIVPGQRAAGIALGARAADVLRRAGTRAFTEEPVINTCVQVPTGILRYRSAAVDFWAEDGAVIQVMVRGDYRGTIQGKVGIGATLGEAEAALGPIGEDDVGNPSASALPGMSFAVAPPPRATRRRDPTDAGLATIQAITIFPPHP